MSPREATRAGAPLPAEPASQPVDVPAVPVRREGGTAPRPPTAVPGTDSAPQPRDVFTGAVELSIPGTRGNWILVGRTPTQNLKLRHKEGETMEVSPGRVLAWNRDLVPENLEVTVPRTGRPPEGGWKVTGPSTLAGFEHCFEVENDALGISKHVPAEMLLDLNPAILQSVPLERSAVAGLARRSPAPGPLARGLERLDATSLPARNAAPRGERRVRFAEPETPERRVRFAEPETPERQSSPPRDASPTAGRRPLPFGLRFASPAPELPQPRLQDPPAQGALQGGGTLAPTLRRMNALRPGDWGRTASPAPAVEPEPRLTRAPVLQRIAANILRPVRRDPASSPPRAPARAPLLDFENLQFERPRARPAAPQRVAAQPLATPPQTAPVPGPLHQGLLAAAARRGGPLLAPPAAFRPITAPAAGPDALIAPRRMPARPDARPIAPPAARPSAPPSAPPPPAAPPSAPPPPAATPASTPEAPRGPTLALETRVQVPRSTGRLDPDFVIVMAWPEKKSVLVMNDHGIQKRLPAADLIALNPQLLPRGAAVNVRNFGLEGSDWKIVGPHPEGAAIQNDSGRQEVVGLESLLASNPDLFFVPRPDSPAESPDNSRPPSPGPRTSPERSPRAGRTSPEVSPRPAPRDGIAEPARAPSDELPLEGVNSLRYQPKFSQPEPLAVSTLSPRARAQAARYTAENHISANERIQDGFYDGGRAARESDGFVRSRREILLVDRQRDQGLMPHLLFAAGVKQMEGAPIDKARALVRHVWGALAAFQGRPSERMQALSEHSGKAVLIGDVEKISGSGVCRHRALFFKVLAEEAGLDVSIQRGNMYGPNGWHVWNVIDLHDGRGPRIIDVMNPSSDDFGRPYFPRVAEPQVQNTYLDVKSQPLYTNAPEGLRT